MHVSLYILILFTYIRPSYWHHAKPNWLKFRALPCTPAMDVFRANFFQASIYLARDQTFSSARWIRSVERSEDASTRPVGVVASRCQRRAWTLRLRRYPWSRRRNLNRRERITWPTCPCPRWHRIRIIVRPDTDHLVHRGRRIHLVLCSIRIIARRDLTGRHARYWFLPNYLNLLFYFRPQVNLFDGQDSTRYSNDCR